MRKRIHRALWAVSLILTWAAPTSGTPAATGAEAEPAREELLEARRASAAGEATRGGTEGGGALLWHQASDGWGAYGPSVRIVNGTPKDQEIADDFELVGEVTRVEAFGTRGFGAPPNPPVYGAEVRFYEVDGDGLPGAVLAEYVLSAGDPNLVYDPQEPNTFDITLSPPFQASGRHFLGVQTVMDAYWYKPSSRHDNPRGSALVVKDYLAGTGWEPYQDAVGVHNDDVAFALYGTLTAPPQITGLSEASLDRSGRLRIFGTNLGAARGQVLIDGQPAWIAEWTDFAINAYVPESAGPGSVPVVVQNAGGDSAPATLDVTLRQPDGQLDWRFTCDSRGVRHRPAVGLDGTIYAQDTDGILYALSPDGGLLWLLDMLHPGAEGPVAVGPDGTLYVATNPLGPDVQVHAVAPDGTLLWTFTDSGSQGLIAGPGVGPDGNVYAVTDVGGLGAFSLTPQGGLRWSNPGSPPFAEHGQLGIEVAFGADRFYVAFDERAQSATSLLYGLDFDGSQLFAVGRPHDNAQPVVGPDGSVYLQYWGSSSGIRLGAYDADGNLQWTAMETPTNTLSAPDVGPEGTIYVVRNRHELRALFPDGSDRWTVTGQGTLYWPVMRPDGEMLLTGGSESSQYGFFKAFDETGTFLWEVQIPTELGYLVGLNTRPLFTADGSRAYVGAEPAANPEDNLHCYVYALNTGEPASLIFADGFESGDTSAWN